MLALVAGLNREDGSSVGAGVVAADVLEMARAGVGVKVDGIDTVDEVGFGAVADSEVGVELAIVVESRLLVTGFWVSSFKISKLGPFRPGCLVDLGVI